MPKYRKLIEHTVDKHRALHGSDAQGKDYREGPKVRKEVPRKNSKGKMTGIVKKL